MEVLDIVISAMLLIAGIGVTFMAINVVKDYRNFKAEQKRRREQRRDVIYAEVNANTADGTSVFFHIEDQDHKRYDFEVDYNLALGFIERIAAATRMADEARQRTINNKRQ